MVLPPAGSPISDGDTPSKGVLQTAIIHAAQRRLALGPGAAAVSLTQRRLDAALALLAGGRAERPHTRLRTLADPRGAAAVRRLAAMSKGGEEQAAAARDFVASVVGAFAGGDAPVTGRGDGAVPPEVANAIAALARLDDEASSGRTTAAAEELAAPPLVAEAAARLLVECAEAAETDAAARSIAVLSQLSSACAAAGGAAGVCGWCGSGGAEAEQPASCRCRRGAGESSSLGAAGGDVAMSSATAHDRLVFAAAVCVGRWGEIQATRAQAAAKVVAAAAALQRAREAADRTLGGLEAKARRQNVALDALTTAILEAAKVVSSGGGQQAADKAAADVVAAVMGEVAGGAARAHG